MRTIHEILIEVRKSHIEDIKQSICLNCDLDGLCEIACYLLPKDEIKVFRDYLFTNVVKITGKDFGMYFWSIKNNNKSRLKWLDKHIELTKPK